MTQTADQGSVGASQQGPNDSSSEYSKVSFLVRQLIAQIETMMPVQVSAVHPGSGSPPAAGTVDVQLLVSQIDGNGNAVQQGIVYGVPYFRLQGSLWAIIIDPAKEDFGFLIAASRDITAVKTNPGIQTPGSLRKYSYSDGVYIGGAFNAVPQATLWLKPDGTWVWSDKPGNVVQSSANGIAVTTAPGGDFTVNGISVTKHTHPVAGIQTGGGEVETGEPVG